MAHIGDVLIRNEHEIPLARQLIQRLSLLVKLSIGNQARLTTAVSQVAQGLFHYCRCVRISFDVLEGEERYNLQVTLEEQTPSPDAAGIHQGSRLSREDVLKWLEGIRTIVTAYSVQAEDGEPIRVTAAKPFPPWQKTVPEETLVEWARTLQEESPSGPIEMILQQNRDLVQVLDALREKEADLEKQIAENKALETMRDDLVHALVHDLRNPLASIRSALSVVVQDQAQNLSHYQQMMVEISYLGAKRMTQLVDNILDVYKLERETLVIERVVFSLGELVASVLELQAPLLREKNLRVRTRIPEDIPPVDGDKQLIERVLQNLLDNAIRFTPENGRITITAARRSFPENTRRKSDVDGFILIGVQDSGPGVPVEARGTLFGKYPAGMGEGGGGLGLVFCRLAIQAHGGEIWVEGEPGEGARFVFSLPLAGELNNDEVVHG